MQVTKRDGQIAEFDKQRIVLAIQKAMARTDIGIDADLSLHIADKIESKLLKEKEPHDIEKIQDSVCLELMKSKRKDVATEYIIYREHRNIARGRKSYDTYMEIVNTKSNDITKENANMNAETPAGMMMKFASETTKQFSDDCLISPEFKEAIRNGFIHIHDKDYMPTKSSTCLQHPIDKILKEGFRAGHGSSRPAKRIETASFLSCISMETAQNEQHGGQAIPAFDFYLAPYVRLTYIEEVKSIEDDIENDLSHMYNMEITDYLKSSLCGLSGEQRWIQKAINKTVDRVHQAMEAFIHNMNVIHSRGKHSASLAQ